MSMARIGCVEDDASVRDALVALLAQNGHEPLTFVDFAHVKEDIVALAPDLVLLDLNLPGTDGMLICREIRAVSTVPIMVVTSRAQEIDEVMCMTMGADDFIVKPYSSHVLLAHIEALLRRVGSLSSVMERDGVRLDVDRSRVSYGERAVELTKNELRILSLLMRRSPAIVSRDELMYELWDSNEFVDDNTLTVNINRLRQTLATIGVNWLKTHRAQGYSLTREA